MMADVVEPTFWGRAEHITDCEQADAEVNPMHPFYTIVQSKDSVCLPADSLDKQPDSEAENNEDV